MLYLRYRLYLRYMQITQVMEGRPCWERLTGERAKAFAAFQHYRDQGPTRTMRATAQMLIKTFDSAYEQQEEEELIAAGKDRRKKVKMSGIKKESTAIGTLHNWATKYEWQARAEFFDLHMDRIRIEQMERDTRDMAHRHIEFSTTLIDLAKKKLELLASGYAECDVCENDDEAKKECKRCEGTGKIYVGSTLTPTEALKFGTEGVKIERMTRLKQSELTGIQEPVVPGENESNQNPREILKARIDAIAEKKRQERERVAAAELAKASEQPIRAETAPAEKPDLHIVRASNA